MSTYVTRERVYIDRIATAWAIRRFVDSHASFVFVPRERDPQSLEGIAFDMRGAELSHRDGKVTFEVLIDRHGIAAPGLRAMAAIVRAVDLGADGDAPPETAGVRAVFDGIRDGIPNDDERMRIGLGVCDALLAYCAARDR